MPVSNPEVVEAYDKHAKRYFEFSFEKILQYPLTQFLEFLPGKTILDAGCGSGRDVDYLVELGYEAVGVDASKALIKEAKENVKADFKLMALEELDFPEGSFDGIWCLAALFYLSKEKAIEVLAKMRPLLKDKGVLYLGLLEGEGEKELSETALDMTPLKIQLYTQHEIEQLLVDAGFTIETSYLEDDDQDRPWLNVFAKKN